MQSMIRKLRLERNMSQKQLAKVIGTSQQTISRIENDVMSSPVDLLVNIADLFDVSVDCLLGRKVRIHKR
ncbi:MAG: helix-turn-helix transcriptional regulator [Clostridia bacterium]|nr:helix-turn-helix transcriptional regulator [[Bacteroides] pectinophilus]MDD5872236.1 helix-turn-helix transcriptional regulator [Clostridia bacterium]